MSNQQNQYSDFRPGDLAVCVAVPGDSANGDGGAKFAPFESDQQRAPTRGQLLVVETVRKGLEMAALGRVWRFDWLYFSGIMGCYNSLAFRRLSRIEEIEAQRRTKSSPTKAAPEKETAL